MAKRRTADGQAVDPKQKVRREPRPTLRGYAGPGRGYQSYLQPAPEWRGSTVQVCGMYPFAAGSGSPITGVTLGTNLLTGSVVGCDPISWFQRAHLINNPSAFVLGLPGLGKSSLVRRWILGLSGYGIIPLILGDTKPDHVNLVRALGGQVITLGPGRGHLNVLDPGSAIEAVEQLQHRASRAHAAGDEAHAGELLELADRLRAEAADLRLTMVLSLITIARREPPTDREEAVVERALQLLDERFDGVPLLEDLLAMIRSADPDLQLVAVSRGRHERYLELIESLEATLQGLINSSRFGDTFSKHTDVPMRRDRAVVFDVSGISENNQEMQAAILLACWSYGFGTVRVAEALAEAELEPRRHYFVVMDEVWKTLRVGRGLVGRIDELTRLNRQRGVGQVMITHTMKDLELADKHETAIARGFVERAAMKILGGLPAAEMQAVESVVSLSQAERDMIVSWDSPPGWADAGAEPPGRGKFLIKVGGRPGIPIRVRLTEQEREVNDTNQAWHVQSRIGRDRPALHAVNG